MSSENGRDSVMSLSKYCPPMRTLIPLSIPVHHRRMKGRLGGPPAKTLMGFLCSFTFLSWTKTGWWWFSI